MRSLEELIVRHDSAWPRVQEWIRDSPHRVEASPAHEQRAAQTLIALQVTTRSTLGAMAFHAGALLVDDGWVRLLGGGTGHDAGDLASWNGLGPNPIRATIPNLFIVGYDVLGGFFAINAGAVGPDDKHVWYLAPDTLRWESLDLGYSDFVRFVCLGNLERFYEGYRWSGWKEEVRAVSFDRALHFAPPLFGKEGKNVAAAHRRDVPAEELFRLQLDLAIELAEVPEGTEVKLSVT